MKKIFLKIILIINFFLIYNCKAQTTTDYINMYNEVTPKLTSIIPYKTQYYNQNFSVFYNELQNKNINIIMMGCDYKTDFDTKYYILKLYPYNVKMIRIAADNSFVHPLIYITFKDQIPSQVDNLIFQYHAQWNPTFEQFFANMKIEKIDFIGVKGYNVKDYSE